MRSVFPTRIEIRRLAHTSCCWEYGLLIYEICKFNLNTEDVVCTAEGAVLHDAILPLTQFFITPLQWSKVEPIFTFCNASVNGFGHC